MTEMLLIGWACLVTGFLGGVAWNARAYYRGWRDRDELTRERS